MCGKSMLGSLYLSILLISCISFDFGSANSSGEEIEEIVPIRPTPLECCKNAGVPEFCLGLCIPADAMARQRNRFNACAKYDAIIDGCYDQIQETSDDKDGPTIYHGSPAIVRTQSKRQQPQRGIEIPKQDSCTVKGNPGDGESQGTCGEGLFCFPDGSCKPGFIFKENNGCNCPYVDGVYGSNRDAVLNECINNPRCECVNYDRAGEKHFYPYYGCADTYLMPDSGMDCWIKVN